MTFDEDDLLCEFVTTQLPDGRFEHACKLCGRPVIFTVPKRLARGCEVKKKTAWNAGKRRPTRARPISPGPGSVLMAMLAQLRFNSKKGCQCKQRAAQMDVWGVDGWRQRRAEIIAWLRESYTTTNWTEKLVASGLAIVSGLAFRLDLADPFGSLVDEVVRRCDQAGDRRPETRGTDAAEPARIQQN